MTDRGLGEFRDWTPEDVLEKLSAQGITGLDDLVRRSLERARADVAFDEVAADFLREWYIPEPPDREGGDTEA